MNKSTPKNDLRPK